MYKINKENTKVKELLELDLKISAAAADEEIEERKIIVKARR